jgi:hypothetical protein
MNENVLGRSFSWPQITDRGNASKHRDAMIETDFTTIILRLLS